MSASENVVLRQQYLRSISAYDYLRGLMAARWMLSHRLFAARRQNKLVLQMQSVSIAYRKLLEQARSETPSESSEEFASSPSSDLDHKLR